MSDFDTHLEEFQRYLDYLDYEAEYTRQLREQAEEARRTGIAQMPPQKNPQVYDGARLGEAVQWSADILPSMREALFTLRGIADTSSLSEYDPRTIRELEKVDRLLRKLD